MGEGAGLYMYVVVVQKFTFAISSPDEFLFGILTRPITYSQKPHGHRRKIRRKTRFCARMCLLVVAKPKL